ncbi:MAG: tetratricopeptide repeat protein [Thermoguttaceae bacterium]|jgi:tetratricopeptide (TPR) repeat protein
MMKSKLDLRGSLLWGITLWGILSLSVPLSGRAQEVNLPPPPELMGVRPGVTTLDELGRNPAFGKLQAQNRLGEYDVYACRIPNLPDIPFVQFLVKDGRVEVVVANLREPCGLSDARVSFQESTGNYQPILIQDAEGKYREIYPETGVSFILKKSEDDPSKPSDKIVQIVMEQTKPDFFLVRADENRRKLLGEGSIAGICTDAETVLKLDPNNASAYWLLATADYLVEDYSGAIELVTQAVQRNDRVPEYHFLMLNLLERTNAIDNGLRYWEAVREICSTNPYHIVELSTLRAALLLKKSEVDCDTAITELQKTVETLKLLASEGKGERDRLRTLELTAKAYTVLGSAIAAKEWKDSAERAKAYLWFKAAKTILEKAIPKNPAAVISLFDLWRAASEAALADPAKTEIDVFLIEMPAVAESCLQRTAGSLEEEMIRIKTGETFFNAFLAADTRGDKQVAEIYALKTCEYLAPCLETDPHRIISIIGPVDYELGIYFNDSENHRDLAPPLLASAAQSVSASLAFDGSAQDGDQGIRLVNIGKAYWHANEQQRGLELTKQGVDLIETAVKARNFPKEEYTIPCQNLITIYKALGDSENAEIYTEKLNTLLEGFPQSH